MDEDTLNQAIQLSKAGRNSDARKLLRPLLEVEPENELAWLWFANSFDSLEERIKALKNCLAYCPGSQIAADGVQALEEQLKAAVPVQKEEPVNLSDDLRVTGGAVFTEVEDDLDQRPFSEGNVSDPLVQPFIDRLDQVNSTGAIVKTALDGNVLPQSSEQKVWGGVSESRGEGKAVSPFTASILDEVAGETIYGNSTSGEDFEKDTGSGYKIPFIIVSITGSILLVVFAIIMFVLFIGR